MPKLNIKNIYEWPIMTKTLIVGLICAGFFYLGYLFDVVDLDKKLNNTKTKMNDLNQQIELVIGKQNKMKNAVASLDESKRTLNQLQKQVINYNDIPQLLNEILKIGANEQIHFSLFSPDKDVSANAYFKIPIHILAVGSYHQLADFISQVANLPWIVVIGDFTISNDYKNDVLGSKLAEFAAAQNLLTADLKLEVYHYAKNNQQK